MQQLWPVPPQNTDLWNQKPPKYSADPCHYMCQVYPQGFNPDRAFVEECETAV